MSRITATTGRLPVPQLNGYRMDELRNRSPQLVAKSLSPLRGLGIAVVPHGLRHGLLSGRRSAGKTKRAELLCAWHFENRSNVDSKLILYK